MIFELCENSSKQQCPDCNAYWEIDTVLCSCGRNLKSSQRPKEFERNNNDVSSILAMLLRRIAVAVPNMDLLNDKECTTRQKRCCKKLVKKSTQTIHPYLHDGTTTTNTEIRCPSLDGLSRTSCCLTSLPWRIIHTSRQKLRQFEIRHIGILTLNQERAQQPLHQRPDFAHAKRECKRFHDEHMAKTQQDERTISSQSPYKTAKKTSV